MIRFDESTLRDFDSAASREWLETNGIGGFASSTIIGLNTRRYHGLLIAAMHPPAGRIVLLSKLEETVVIDNERYDLSTNQYSGAVHPKGFLHLHEFRLDPFPTFTFDLNGLRIEKTLRYGIRMDPDGLIASSDPSVQLTWTGCQDRGVGCDTAQW